MELAAIPYLIDANVLVGAYDSSDAHHDASLNMLVDLVEAQGTGIVLDHVIQEVITVLLYRSANTHAKEFLSRLVTDPLFFVVESTFSWIQDALALAEMQHFRPKISTTDWLLLSRSISTDAPILTFDKQLLAASKKLC